MTEGEIKELADLGIYNNKPLKGKLEETHISWVILTEEYAFKIKKPIALSFLDFSTLSLRKHYCEREITLNNRFTDIYLNVVPIYVSNGKWSIDEGKGEAVEYAVVMKRLITSRRMDKLLQLKEVDDEGIKSLAALVASFHSSAEKIYTPFVLSEARSLFNDIAQVKNFIEERLGITYIRIIEECTQWSDQFLKLHTNRLQQRIDLGLKRDVHGDLHSGNIFLYKKPIIFDCIEFNDQYRQIDVLYEVAFLCMDLESFGQKHLADIFISEYAQKFPCFQQKEDEDIFIYFKALRANVRAKVYAMAAMQLHNEQGLKHHLDKIEKYLVSMGSYMSQPVI